MTQIFEKNYKKVKKKFFLSLRVPTCRDEESRIIQIDSSVAIAPSE